MAFNLKVGGWRDWASMARLPNLPTVWSNVFTGWVLGQESFTDQSGRANFCWALLLSTMLYVGGTILNDCHDANSDRQHRPERPIPVGRVSGSLACLVGVFLLGLGTVMSAYLDITGWKNFLYFLLPLILLYTFIHKKFPFIGGILMGLCRMTLGVSAIFFFSVIWRVINIDPIWVITLFLYICIVSWIAMGETVAWRRKMVIGMLTALPLLDMFFLVVAGEARMIFVPLGCFGLAWYLRRVASPT